MKGLVETRARVDAEYNRLATLIAELTAKIAKVEAERNSCDQLITNLNSQIKPAYIEPVYAWQGRYGKRGALKQALLNLVTTAYPNSISTTQLSSCLEALFSLTFATQDERTQWVNNSIGKQLRGLVYDNIIERIHNPARCAGHPGTWRWIPPDQAFTDLQALAAQAGLPTSCALYQDCLELEPAPEDDDLPR